MTSSLFYPFFERGLLQLHDEIMQYPSEESIWEVHGKVKNPSGNLCLHLCGNLNHFIGAILSNNGYIRNREAEFTLSGINKAGLLKQIESTQKMISVYFASTDPSIFDKIFPDTTFGQDKTTEWVLIHLLNHFNYHLGQINYKRRLFENPIL
jgi:hypothetical protein